MKITPEEARRIAALAHLQLDDPALDRLAADMTAILGYVQSLGVSDAGEAGARPDLSTPLREDIVRPSLDRAVVAANAPLWDDGFFVVPKVIA